MSLVCEYKVKIQNLEKSEQLHDMLTHILATKVSINISEGNLLKSLERAITLQREDVNKLKKHHFKALNEMRAPAKLFTVNPKRE